MKEEIKNSSISSYGANYFIIVRRKILEIFLYLKNNLLSVLYRAIITKKINTVILRGRVKFPIGGKVRERVSAGFRSV